MHQTNKNIILVGMPTMKSSCLLSLITANGLGQLSVQFLNRADSHIIHSNHPTATRLLHVVFQGTHLLNVFLIYTQTTSLTYYSNITLRWYHSPLNLWKTIFCFLKLVIQVFLVFITQISNYSRPSQQLNIIMPNNYSQWDL